MASEEVTGITQEEVDVMRENFEDTPQSQWYDFKEYYCVWKIPRQPEDYDGPQRYCAKTADGEKDGFYRCDSHKHWGCNNSQNLTPGNPKHFMQATDKYLLEHLSEEEEQLYENILDWAEIYGIDPEEDPAAYDDLKLLAKQRVREVKCSQYLFEEGEIRDKVLRDEEGQVILDEDGEPKTEDDTNVISEEYRRLINLISSLKKDLLMTRKEQAKASDRNIMSESAEKTSDAMRELISDDDKTFEVESYDEDEI